MFSLNNITTLLPNPRVLYNTFNFYTIQYRYRRSDFDNHSDYCVNSLPFIFIRWSYVGKGIYYNLITLTRNSCLHGREGWILNFRLLVFICVLTYSFTYLPTEIRPPEEWTGLMTPIGSSLCKVSFFRPSRWSRWMSTYRIKKKKNWKRSNKRPNKTISCDSYGIELNVNGKRVIVYTWLHTPDSSLTSHV